MHGSSDPVHSTHPACTGTPEHGIGDMTAGDADLISLIEDALTAASPDDLELALARVMRHPHLSREERAAFYAVWEELSDTLLERWHDLSERRDLVAWDALHRRGSLQVDSSTGPGRAEPEHGQP